MSFVSGPEKNSLLEGNNKAAMTLQPRLPTARKVPLHLLDERWRKPCCVFLIEKCDDANFVKVCVLVLTINVFNYALSQLG